MSQAQARFQLKLPPLGGGAFGLVYLAYDTALEEQVAVKVPHDEEKERALISEAKLMSQIRELHEPHVVSLHDLHEIDGRQVIVMEYVGPSLRAKLGKIGEQHPLDTEEALDIAMQACLGLYALHNAFRHSGVFHRDVKPENILIRSSDSLVKIADFGIATILESSGLASTTIGTLPYMSRELLEGEGADFRADIYSLGVTLYEMLTARLPFNPWDSAGKAKAHMTYAREICRGHPPTPADITDVDKELSEIVLKAVDCEASKRHQSAQELHDALEDFHSRLSVDNAVAAAWEKEEPAACERALKDIVKRFPRNPKGYRNLGWFYNRQRRFAETVRTLEKGRTNCPGCGELLVDLAQAYRWVGQIQRAVDTLEEARRQGLPEDMLKRVTLLLDTWRRMV